MSSEAPTPAKGIFMALKGTPAISFHSSRTDMQWLIYRKSFIGLSITFTILSLLITAVDLGKKKESYLETVQQLPPGVAEHADGLAMFMYYNDIILFCVALLSFAVSIEGYKRVEGNTSSSCFLVRFAWICNTAMPFLTLMIVAGRSQVDWDGAVEGLCNNTFANVMGSNGRYPGMFNLIQSIEASPLVAVDPAFSEATAEVAIPKFCGKHSWDWSVEFFGPLPTGSSSNQPPALEDIASICGAGQEEIFQNLADPDYPVARKLICITATCAALSSATGICPPACADVSPVMCEVTPVQSLEIAAYMVSLQASAIGASVALRSSEFIVGVIMGLYCGQVLLPPAISIVMGILGGINNVRYLFPSDTILSRLSLFTSLLSLPLLSSFLATMQQMMGGFELSPAVLLLLGAGCSVFYGTGTILSPNATVPSLRSAFGKQGKIKILLGGVASISFVYYVSYSNARLMEYVDLLALMGGWEGLLVMLIATLGRSSLTKVVSVDLILYGLWKSHDDLDNTISTEGSTKRLEDMKSFGELLKSKPTSKATVTPE
ncbi:hypothetical protein TrCOL_g5372 [Triparma columacea]|uniref:Uncharacterized protein n=1 Tax=Triparma columacea TaxID=722753 RepID=A0A9W7GKL6_9STRA|nr:hypothetical protein TrCOL_g5372 [Triparma columacea]